MFLGKRKNPAEDEVMDLEAVMQKFDRESNTRIWEGVPKVFVTVILALFSLFCIYLAQMYVGYDIDKKQVLNGFMTVFMLKI